VYEQTEAGFLLLDLMKEAADTFESLLIYDLFVLPEFRRRGIGQAAIMHAERIALPGQYRNMIVIAHPLDETNTTESLIAYYSKFGFRPYTEAGAEHLKKELQPHLRG
jgi:GNAT superfamily N-acetyltransferase